MNYENCDFQIKTEHKVEAADLESPTEWAPLSRDKSVKEKVLGFFKDESDSDDSYEKWYYGGGPDDLNNVFEHLKAAKKEYL